MSPRLSRRGFLGLAGLTAAGAALTACDRNTSLNPLDWQPLPTAQPTPTPRSSEPLDSGAALALLLDGNRRYVIDRRERPDQGPERREEVAEGQTPFAAILSCADSRVPPEYVFDQGLGDLFVVRVAGNLLSPTVLASLEYGAEHLGIPLILVLGHRHCGAVKAALETVKKGGAAPGHIASLVTALRPAVSGDTLPLGEDPVDWAVRKNVGLVVDQCAARSVILSTRLKSGALRVLGGYYDLDTGAVQVIV